MDLRSRLSESLLYANIGPRDHPYRQKVFVTATYSWLASGAFGLLALLHAFGERDVRLSLLEAVCSATMLVIALGLVITKNVVLARTCFLLTVLILLMAMLITGGYEYTGQLWLITFPVGAFFLTDIVGGVWWVLAELVTIGLLVTLAHYGFVTLAYEDQAIIQIVLTLVVISIALFAYQRSREQLQTQAAESGRNLRAEQLKAEVIIENIGEAVLATDQRGAIVFVNRTGAAMLGWRADDLLGQKFITAVPMLDDQGKRVPSDQRPLRTLLEESRSMRTTATYVRKDGSTFRAFALASPIIVDGKQLGSIGLIRDITAEDKVDRAKTEFIALASHQLRTPLSAIGWLSELLLNGDAGKVSKEQHRYIQQINDSKLRMARLLDDMLMVSALEAGSFAITPEPVDIPEIAHQVVAREAALQNEPGKLRLAEEYGPHLTHAHVDLVVIRTVLQALISNACKYTPANGIVSVTVKCSDERPNATCASSISIEVSDTGYGIPGAEQTQIFHKMFRASNIITKDTDGTGLGLFIVKAILDYIGGSISFTSALDQGSTFRVLLPLGTAPPLKAVDHA